VLNISGNNLASLGTLAVEPGRPIFVAGTDTDVGKTVVASQLIRLLRRAGWNTAAYKPVASGCTRDEKGQLTSGDAVALWNAMDRMDSLERICPQQFELPLAPPEAARAEGRAVNVDAIISGARSWMLEREVLVCEGAGGLLSPIADNFFNVDLARLLGAKLVVVAANRLGVINHTLQTLIVARHYGLEVAAVVLNQTNASSDLSANTNLEAIRRYAAVPIIVSLGFQQQLDLTLAGPA
jgi:dethiobiotin synthetase